MGNPPLARTTTIWVVILALTLAAAAVATTPSPSAAIITPVGDEHLDPPDSPYPGLDAGRRWLQTRAYFNDPRSPDAHPTTELIVDHFDRALPGSMVTMQTWSLSDPAISAAIVRALRAGVQVRALMPRNNCIAADSGLRAAFTAQPGSWLKCVTGSARGTGGTLHQKSYTFSVLGGPGRVGVAAREVTVVGSANATTSGVVNQWVDMYQFVGRHDVFERYQQIFALQTPDTAEARPFRSWRLGSGDSVQFYPINVADPGPAADPAHQRLAAIPGGPSTTVRVANYAFWGRRGTWLGDELVRLHNAGSRVQLIAGPRSDTRLLARLRAAGIDIVLGYDGATTSYPCPGLPNTGPCNFVHLKAMIANYRSGSGDQQFRVWTGSDNWGDTPLHNDEVVQQIAGRSAYRQYDAYLTTIAEVYR